MILIKYKDAIEILWWCHAERTDPGSQVQLHPASQALGNSSLGTVDAIQPGLTAKRIIKVVHKKLNEIDP